MFKLLVLSCLVASCLAGPFHLPTWIQEGWHRRAARGCADRGAGRAACAHVNTTAALAPHPYDCRLFYYCSSVFRPVCRHCPLGLYFNPELQVCDWPNNVNCTATPPPHPPRPTRPEHNATSPAPITTLATDDPTDAPSSIAPSTDAPSSIAPSTDAPSTVAPSTVAPSTVAPSTVAPSTVAPSTVAPSTIAPSTNTPSTIAPSTNAPSTDAPSTDPTTDLPSTNAPSTIAL